MFVINTDKEKQIHETLKCEACNLYKTNKVLFMFNMRIHSGIIVTNY